MNVSTPLLDSDPRMVAWKAYKNTPAYHNSRHWVAMQEHREGSMWAVFLAGWESCRDDLIIPASDNKHQSVPTCESKEPYKIGQSHTPTKQGGEY